MMEAAFGRNVIAFVRKVGNWDRLSEVLHNFQQEHQCMVDVTWKKKVWQIDVSQILYIQSADITVGWSFICRESLCRHCSLIR